MSTYASSQRTVQLGSALQSVGAPKRGLIKPMAEEGQRTQTGRKVNGEFNTAADMAYHGLSFWHPVPYTVQVRAAKPTTSVAC